MISERRFDSVWNGGWIFLEGGSIQGGSGMFGIGVGLFHQGAKANGKKRLAYPDFCNLISSVGGFHCLYICLKGG